MKTKIKAFTIPETLIFLTIVGVISVSMLTIIKPQEIYLPYAYYGAYNALKTAAINIHNDATLNYLDGSEDIPDEDKRFPGAYAEHDASTAARELCKKLAIDPKATNVEEYGYINSSVNKCSDFTIASDDGSFDGSLAFKASNSMNFYISKKGQLNVDDDMNGVTTKVDYFIVWADLNGDRNPNTANWSIKRPADIVPFIITTGGAVLPAGAPITDTRYTTARVKYPTDTIVRYLPRSTTYLAAQQRAYGDKEYPIYDQHSINATFRSKFEKTLYKDNQTQITQIISGDKKVEIEDKCDIDDATSASCQVELDENVKR